MTVMVARGTKSLTIPGKKGFLQWLKKSQPAIYRDIQPRLTAGLSGFGLTDPATVAPAAPASKTWADSLKDVITVASQAYLTKQQMDAQKKIIDVQLQLAQQGKPMLDIDMDQLGVPRAQLQIGPTEQLMTIGGWVLGGAFVLWLTSTILRGRRH